MTTSRNNAILEDDLKVKQLSLIRMTCTSFVYLSVRCSHHLINIIHIDVLPNGNFSPQRRRSRFERLPRLWKVGCSNPVVTDQTRWKILPNPRQLVGMKRVLGVKDIYKWMFYATVGAIRQRIFAARRL